MNNYPGNNTALTDFPQTFRVGPPNIALRVSEPCLLNLEPYTLLLCLLFGQVLNETRAGAPFLSERLGTAVDSVCLCAESASSPYIALQCSESAPPPPHRTSRWPPSRHQLLPRAVDASPQIHGYGRYHTCGQMQRTERRLSAQLQYSSPLCLRSRRVRCHRTS